MNKQNTNLDVVDLFNKLKKDFPEITFIIEDEDKELNRTIHNFKITKVYNQTFVKPIKTTISLMKDSYMSESEYFHLHSDMVRSFGKNKTFGLL